MGILFRPLDTILASRSRVAVVRALLESGAGVSAREAGRLAGIAHSGALRALDDLVVLGIVERLETRGQHIYTLNLRHRLVDQGLVPLFAAERGRVGEVFDWMAETLEPYLESNIVLSAVIFGSAARGEDGPGSDLDVLVAVRKPADVEPVHDHLANASTELFQYFGLSLSPVVVDAEQLARQFRGGGTFVRAVLREGRHVAGTPLDALLRVATPTAK